MSWTTGMTVLLATAALACGGEQVDVERDGGSDAAAVGGNDGNDGNDGNALGGVVAVDCASAVIARTITTPGLRFEPKSSRIARGAVVKFDPSADHDVLSSATGLFSVALGGEGCFRFDEPGTFGFRCVPHGFVGDLVVE